MTDVSQADDGRERLVQDLRQSAILDWWRDWRASDYTWDGLANTPLPGWWVAEDGEVLPVPPDDGRNFDEATQQDLWRAEADDLISGIDGTFTRFHLPFVWSDGSSTGKSTWGSRARREFDARIRSILSKSRNATGEPRSQLVIAGVIFPKKYEHQSGQSEEPLDCSFEECWFDGIADFTDTVFLKTSHFNRVHFNSTARFERLTITEGLDFDSCLFSNHARYAGTKVEQFLIFNGSKFFNNCRLSSIVVEGILDLEGAKFYKDLSLQGSSFKQGLDLKAGKIFGNFSIRSAIIEEMLYFESFEVQGLASFSSGKFNGEVYFVESEFDRAIFSKANFGSSVTCASLKFRNSVRFKGAKFIGYADFSGAQFPSSAAGYRQAFRDVCFSGGADFSGKNFRAFAALDEAIFERPPLFSIVGGRESHIIGDAILAARQAAVVLSTKKRSDGEYRPLSEALEEQFASLEAGCRVLKQAMEARRARTEEQMLYRWELRAHTCRPSTSVFYKVAAFFYRHIGNYGSNYAVPLFVLIAMYLICAVIYAICYANIFHGGQAIGPIVAYNFPEALTFSAKNIFKPFMAWENIHPDSSSWSATILSKSPAGLSLGIRAFASFESLVSLSLLFLAGLALKRRFQIS